MNAVAQEIAPAAVPAPRFTKIGSAGEDLPADAKKWDAVRDNRTGLMWSVAQKQVDHWNKAEAAAKRIKAGGFKDWRLPTVEELFLLADRTRVSPAIDTDYFPKCDGGWYCSSTACASSPGDYAWGVDFYDGDAGWVRQDCDGGLVRAVRASQ